MTLADITIQRIEKVLSQDKKNAQAEIIKVLESDIHNLLDNYFSLENLNLSLSVVNSKFILNITATATHQKNLGIIY